MTKYTIRYQYGLYVADNNIGNTIWSKSRWLLENLLHQIGCEFEVED